MKIYKLKDGTVLNSSKMISIGLINFSIKTNGNKRMKMLM